MHWCRLHAHALLQRRLRCQRDLRVCELELSLLVLLDQITASTAPGLQAVRGEVSLQVEFLVDVVLLEELGDDVEAAVGGDPEHEALCGCQ